MSQSKHSRTIFAAAVALVVLVQVVSASPVCNCAVTVAEAPCHAPQPVEPKRCCEDPAPASACSGGMSLGCCLDQPAEPGEAAVIVPNADGQLIEPAAGSAIESGVVPAPGIEIRSKLDVLHGAPVYLRHSALLI